MSWNSLGAVQMKKEVAEALAEVLAKNNQLYHVDLSNNCMDVEQCGMLARAILENQVLLGLHLNGNSAMIDNWGYIHVDNYYLNPKPQHLNVRILNPKNSMRIHKFVNEGFTISNC
eukprot:CAMPEP_0201282032 /NCGR_PEP_ID=MMETSP1317-20130820/4672_1 /ASSEMBLY_ACC=CAM_ASM_000770 /TAXON_ID=187299 /ORGANISM="Undescribed Undescribed, Strain Undescribed" /LENGTH=115 /DNA_ID=CAMNT_0047593629 /DNA_START=578 /DNA_END=925 /DNA_ORIENTATION=-